MLKIDPEQLTRIAESHGWLHTSGRLKGTVNARQMAAAIGVNTTTITRAYDGGSVGPRLLLRLKAVSGVSLDDLVRDDAA